MSVARIASRYAKSLIDLSIEQNKLEETLEDVQSFQKATENRDLYLLLKSPIINPTKKQAVIDALFNGKMGEMILGFIRICIRKGRESLLPEIADEFMVQYKIYKHVSTIKLTTAVKLTEEMLSKIKQQLVNSSATDEHVEIVTEVNPDILGGFVIEFDDKLYDSSVAHKLELLKKEFTKNEYVKSF